MKAMILAAGKGERMLPLTQNTPKPLLKVGNRPLIEHHLTRLATAGFTDVLINIAYLGEQIKQALGSGERWGLKIRYSEEPRPLETAGAIANALDVLGSEPFLLVNGDVWTDFPFESLLQYPSSDTLGHLILVQNPEHNPNGDFSIADQQLTYRSEISYTFSGISIIDPKLISTYPKRREIFPLGEVFKYGIQSNCLTASIYRGSWIDVGTVERLNNLNEILKRAE